MQRYDQKTADYWLSKLESYSKTVSTRTLARAVQFQQQNKKSNLSIYDCVGYIYSMDNNIKFVTGDRQFKGLPGVLFIPSN